MPTIQLDQTSYDVGEGIGTVTVCAVLGNVMSVGGNTSADITSNFVLTTGTTGMCSM